jgi:hypothetical protein
MSHMRSCRFYRRPYAVWQIQTWRLCFERSEAIRIFGS